MADHDTPRPTDETTDEPLERHPSPGQLPSDTDVQAERQEEGVEAEVAAVEEGAAEEPVHKVEGGDIGDGAD
jgi:hypothetical protein